MATKPPTDEELLAPARKLWPDSPLYIVLCNINFSEDDALDFLCKEIVLPFVPRKGIRLVVDVPYCPMKRMQSVVLLITDEPTIFTASGIITVESVIAQGQIHTVLVPALREFLQQSGWHA